MTTPTSTTPAPLGSSLRGSATGTAAPRGLLSVILGARSVVVVSRESAAAPLTLPWSPDAPDTLAESLRTHLGSATGFVVVVSTVLLEIAEPDIPPLAPGDARALLWRDADRYFAIDESVAVVLANRVAFAVAARRLTSWVQALERIAPVRSIVCAAHVAAVSQRAGTVRVEIADEIDSIIQCRDGGVDAIRRHASDPGDATNARATYALLDSGTLGRAALAWADAPASVQLLDVALATRERRATHRRWTLAGVAAACSAVVLLWSANARQSRVLAALSSRVEQLEADAAPAERALMRLERARQELDALTAARAQASSVDNPLHVLEQLGRVLPRDAFVQRVEWDGSGWRVEGTADQAPRLIPLLDADAHFADVRIAAPSQRFLDAGRQRETFAIGFRMRLPSAGASHGAP